jgi:FdhD protein
LEATYTVPITKIKGESRFTTDDTLIREIALEIMVNGETIALLMATPIDQKLLAIGYLMSEGILSHVDDIASMALENDGMRVVMEAKIDRERAEKLNSEGIISSGCGRGRSANITPETIEAKVIRSDYSLSASLLSKEMGQFYTECPLYEATGCVHTAKLYIDETTAFIAEDIAQHNTIDKAVGKALLAGADITKAFLMVSGRLSSEMVAKAVMHQIPVIASRTASTCLGLQIADKFGLTLIGFVRGDTMNIYKNPHRII